jgi:hypothetical protein
MTITSAFHLRAYQRDDRDLVMSLLEILPKLYPKGGEWLDRRLSDALDRKANCLVTVSGLLIKRVAIQTPNGHGGFGTWAADVSRYPSDISAFMLGHDSLQP